MSETPQVLRRMIVAAMNARQVESARVSRLLHDEVGQVLSAVGLQLDVLKLDYKHDSPEIAGRIRELQEMLDKAVQQVRSLSYDLNPSVVDRSGLQNALDRLAGRFRTGFGGTLRLAYDPAVRVPVEVANVWYKITEIALDNSIKHAGAKRIEVVVRPSADSFVLEVRDDGCGFLVDEVRSRAPGLGLLMIDQFATQVPIQVELRSRPGKGSSVRSTWQKCAVAEAKLHNPDSHAI